MRFTWRAVSAALVTPAIVAAALLSALAPAQAAVRPATAVPPSPSTALAGTWVNTNHGTRSLVVLVVAATATGITADGFGACTPTLCQWGRIAGTVYGPNVSAKTGTSFAAQWNFGFARTLLLATYSDPKKVPTLTVKEFTTFTDDTNRGNYVVTEKFTKGQARRTSTTGTSATDYPLGKPVAPVSTLPAIWVNTASTGTLQAVILTKVNGLLRVHAYGECSPAPCNWGTVTGNTFGPSVTATVGNTFVAPYKFSFANKVLDGSVNAAGTRLTVQTWTEFTDGSGRSNYASTDTFLPLR